jgi:hypothetical protein
MGIDTIQPGRETEKGGHMAVYKVGKSRSVTNMYPAVCVPFFFLSVGTMHPFPPLVCTGVKGRKSDNMADYIRMQ